MCKIKKVVYFVCKIDEKFAMADVVAFGTLNYKLCYTLWPTINSIVILDGKPKFMMQSVIKSLI